MNLVAWTLEAREKWRGRLSLCVELDHMQGANYNGSTDKIGAAEDQAIDMRCNGEADDVHVGSSIELAIVVRQHVIVSRLECRKSDVYFCTVARFVRQREGLPLASN